MNRRFEHVNSKNIKELSFKNYFNLIFYFKNNSCSTDYSSVFLLKHNTTMMFRWK